MQLHPSQRRRRLLGSCPALQHHAGSADPIQYGPKFCNIVLKNQTVCCSAGSLPDFSPKPYPNGTCYTYVVNPDDTCYSIATANQMNASNIPIYNTQSWGWQGCNPLQKGQKICLSSGTPPFPAPVSGVVCGPQVRSSPLSPSLLLKIPARAHKNGLHQGSWHHAACQLKLVVGLGSAEPVPPQCVL